MIRKITFILLLLSIFSANATTLKIATLSPDGTMWMKLMRQGGKDIAAQTEGRVKLKFYPGGVMGTDAAVLRKMRLGQLHGAAVPTGAVYDKAINLMLLNLPALFNDFDEVDLVRKEFDPIFMAEIEKGGLVPMGFAEGGFAYLMSKQDISSLTKIQQRKVWVPDTDPFVASVVEGFGINPIPLGIGDVLASLQTGMIDTIASSPTGGIALQWHTQVSHVMDFPILYFIGTMVFDKRAFNRVKPADQEIVKKIMADIFSKIDKQNRKDNLAAFAALKQMGLTMQSLDEREAEEWRAKAYELTDKLVQRKVSSELYNKLREILKQHRAQ